MKKLVAVMLTVTLLCVAGYAVGNGGVGLDGEETRISLDYPIDIILPAISFTPEDEGEPDRSYIVGGKAMGIVAANRPVKQGFTVINQVAYDADYEAGETLAYLAGTELIGISKDGNEWGFVKPGATAKWGGRTVSVFYKGAQHTLTIYMDTGSLGQYQVTVRALNVRSGAGTTHSKLGELAQGTNVEVIAIEGNWAQIKYGSGTAGVSLKYIKKHNA